MLNLKSAPIDSRVVVLLDDVRAWAQKRAEITGVALVGSHAHGKARPDSDIDLIILSEQVDILRSSEWLTALGSLRSVTTENWGILTAHRAIYERDGEVEVGVAPTSWAAIPVDAGTFRVVNDGIVSVYDPLGALERLTAEVQRMKNG